MPAAGNVGGLEDALRQRHPLPPKAAMAATPLSNDSDLHVKHRTVVGSDDSEAIGR
jgi:hypothetical protein